MDGIAHVFFDAIGIEIVQAETPAPAAGPHFTASILLGDHGDRHPHQRTNVSCQRAVCASDHHDVILAGQPGHHLLDPRVLGTCELFGALQQLHFGCAVERGDRVRAPVERPGAGNLLGADPAARVAAARGDRAHGARGVQQRCL